MDLTEPRRRKKPLRVKPGRREQQRRDTIDHRIKADQRDPEKPRTAAVRRRDAQGRRVQKAEGRRTKAEQRERDLYRKVVEELERRQFKRTAELLKKREPVERMLALTSFFVAGMTNYASMGIVGVCILFALWYHERGHFNVAKSLGLDPSQPRSIAFVGAVMGLPGSSVAQRARVAYGGPRSGLTFTLITTGLWLLTLFVRLPDWSNGVSNVLFYAAFSSLMLNAFNLIPLEPIDGGWMIKVMNGRFPHVMRVSGVVILGLITALFVLKYDLVTTFIIWVLVLDQLWIICGKKPQEVSTFWRMVAAICIVTGVSIWIVLGVAEGKLSGLKLLGDVVYTFFGGWFVKEYYRQWKYPESDLPEEEVVNEEHDPALGRLMFRNYCKLLAGYALVGSIFYVLT